ncbi:MAG: hypothetical protein ACRDIC_17680, partial [bacterium]
MRGTTTTVARRLALRAYDRPHVPGGRDVAVHELVGHGDLDVEDLEQAIRADQAHELDQAPSREVGRH